MIIKTTLHLTFLPDHTTVGTNSDLQLHIQYKYLGFKTSLFMLFYTCSCYLQSKKNVCHLAHCNLHNNHNVPIRNTSTKLTQKSSSIWVLTPPQLVTIIQQTNLIASYYFFLNLYMHVKDRKTCTQEMRVKLFLLSLYSRCLFSKLYSTYIRLFTISAVSN